jgi:hypothetical protein
MRRAGIAVTKPGTEVGTMETPRIDVEEILEELRTTRDELRLQMRLGGAEVRDEWEVLEKKWERFRAKAGQIGEATGEAAEDVGGALGQVGEELRKGYKRIRKAL